MFAFSLKFLFECLVVHLSQGMYGSQRGQLARVLGMNLSAHKAWHVAGPAFSLILIAPFSDDTSLFSF